MKVGLIAYTNNPEQVISRAAGLCYGRDNYSEERIRNCYKAGHGSILEHASVTYLVEGISRSCSHQLVRQRLASYSQQSQRYLKLDSSNNDDWYVIPPSIEKYGEYALGLYKQSMQRQADLYESFLDLGVKPEDARFVLPEASKTSITVTMNYRELFHFFDLRLGKRAQWEIRELANKMLDLLDVASPLMKELYLDNCENTRVN